MQKKTYAELLKDPRWQKRKTEILLRDNFTCQKCGCMDKTLHVHHIFYDGRNPWDYEDEALITLCEDCHNKEHGKSIPKIGKFYKLYHSDFCNDMVCYHIDNKNKLVYLFGIDNGAYANGYIEIVSYDSFCKYPESDIIPGDLHSERNTYSLSSLYYAYADLLNGKAEIYGHKIYDDNLIIEYAKDKVRLLFECNEILSSILYEYNQENGLF